MKACHSQVVLQFFCVAYIWFEFCFVYCDHQITTIVHHHHLITLALRLVCSDSIDEPMNLRWALLYALLESSFFTLCLNHRHHQSSIANHHRNHHRKINQRFCHHSQSSSILTLNQHDYQYITCDIVMMNSDHRQLPLVSTAALTSSTFWSVNKCLMSLCWAFNRFP